MRAKKISALSALIAAAMTLSLSACTCGGAPQGAQQQEAQSAEQEATAPAPSDEPAQADEAAAGHSDDEPAHPRVNLDGFRRDLERTLNDRQNDSLRLNPEGSLQLRPPLGGAPAEPSGQMQLRLGQ